jgi:hypothetical protein
MISETLPLNEWPSEKLKGLLNVIELGQIYSTYDPTNQDCLEFKSCVIMAIKDAEERESKLPF